jgi:hypothetical protein
MPKPSLRCCRSRSRKQGQKHYRIHLLAVNDQDAPPLRAITYQPGWRRPVWLTAAVAVLLLLRLAGVWLRPRVANRFGNYQARMVGEAQHEYTMDLVTNDMRQVREFMAQRSAPADYSLPRGLARCQLTGGGRLTWRSNPVTMVCFDRGDKQMLFLFIMKRSAVKDLPRKDLAWPGSAKCSQPVGHRETIPTSWPGRKKPISLKSISRSCRPLGKGPAGRPRPPSPAPAGWVCRVLPGGNNYW